MWYNGIIPIGMLYFGSQYKRHIPSWANPILQKLHILHLNLVMTNMFIEVFKTGITVFAFKFLLMIDSLCSFNWQKCPKLESHNVWPVNIVRPKLTPRPKQPGDTKFLSKLAPRCILACISKLAPLYPNWPHLARLFGPWGQFGLDNIDGPDVT